MKKLRKIKLTDLSQKVLEDNQMNVLRGGYGSCSCLCQTGASGSASSVCGCKTAANTGCS